MSQRSTEDNALYDSTAAGAATLAVASTARTGDAPAARAAPDRFDVLRAGRLAVRRLRCRVLAYVGTHHVHVELRTLGSSLRWRAVHAVRQPVARMAASGLSAALAVLDAALRELRVAVARDIGADFGGARCEVILADAWIAYDVVPVDLAMLSPALAQRAIATAMGDVLGMPADTLSVRWQRRRDGRGAFGMALRTDDLALVRQTVAAQRLRLSGVTGELIDVLNRQRTELPPGRAVVAVVRAAGTQFATLFGGEVALAQFETGLDDAFALPEAARRALSARGLEVTAAMDYCVDAGRPAPTVDMPAAGVWHWLAAPAWAHAR